MATFIALITETQRGEENISQSVSRAAKFREDAAKFGATVRETFWTLGRFDGVLVFDAPDDETAAALMCKLNAQGAVRTHTMRAFADQEMEDILKRASS